MALELYPHQAVAAQAAERMLADMGRAAVILPTGTGKSYIAFRLIEQHPEAAFLWLAPSEYIFRTQTANLRRTNPELSLAHVTFRTYASLIYQSPESLAAMPCDYIVLDEFHRCGAEQWGTAVQQLLETHPQAKLLGLSATHIRYLDHQRNMAEELLDNCIAAEMTLGEAKVYYQAHDNLAVRKDFVTEDGHALGVWLVNQRANRRRGQGRVMTPERVWMLDDIGMRW